MSHTSMWLVASLQTTHTTSVCPCLSLWIIRLTGQLQEVAVQATHSLRAEPRLGKTSSLNKLTENHHLQPPVCFPRKALKVTGSCRGHEAFLCTSFG